MPRRSRAAWRVCAITATPHGSRSQGPRVHLLITSDSEAKTANHEALVDQVIVAPNICATRNLGARSPLQHCTHQTLDLATCVSALRLEKNLKRWSNATLEVAETLWGHSCFFTSSTARNRYTGTPAAQQIVNVWLDGVAIEGNPLIRTHW